MSLPRTSPPGGKALLADLGVSELADIYGTRHAAQADTDPRRCTAPSRPSAGGATPSTSGAPSAASPRWAPPCGSRAAAPWRR
ncbi:hypothetical protein ACR6C2_38030 [Streptomyces sp. INA 01156]